MCLTKKSTLCQADNTRSEPLLPINCLKYSTGHDLVNINTTDCFELDQMARLVHNWVKFEILKGEGEFKNWKKSGYAGCEPILDAAKSVHAPKCSDNFDVISINV